MFDKILLISEGHPIYYGKAWETMDYFSSLKFTPEIPMNPAEFLLDLATGQVNDISVPDEIKKDNVTPASDKAVLKVCNCSYRSYAFFFSRNEGIITHNITCFGLFDHMVM